MSDNRNILGAVCNTCSREINASESLIRAVVQEDNIACSWCLSPLEILLGDCCRHHSEKLYKGYCGACASGELLDNQC